MPFFEYHQNNSGGRFDYKPNRLSRFVIVEAEDAEHADTKAELLGLYWNGVDEGNDCECCGDRWYPKASYWSNPKKGDPVPFVYGTPLDKIIWTSEWMPNEDVVIYQEKWMSLGTPELFVHYSDGTIEAYGAEPTEIVEPVTDEEIRAIRRSLGVDDDS